MSPQTHPPIRSNPSLAPPDGRGCHWRSRRLFNSSLPAPGEETRVMPLGEKVSCQHPKNLTWRLQCFALEGRAGSLSGLRIPHPAGSSSSSSSPPAHGGKAKDPPGPKASAPLAGRALHPTRPRLPGFLVTGALPGPGRELGACRARFRPKGAGVFSGVRDPWRGSVLPNRASRMRTEPRREKGE